MTFSVLSGAMKEFPPALSSTSAPSSARPVTPSTLPHAMPAPYGAVFPIPVLGSRHPIPSNQRPAAPQPASSKAQSEPTILELATSAANIQQIPSTTLEKVKRTTKSPGSAATPPRSIPSQAVSAASVSSSAAIASAAPPPPPPPASKADVNLVNLVDSIITKHHHGEEKNAPVPPPRETSTPSSMYSFQHPSKLLSAMPPASAPLKTEAAVPAIVPISPPAALQQPITFQKHPFSEPVATSASVTHRPPPPTTGASAARPATLFEYIGDIISSDYSAGPANPPTPEVKPRTTPQPILERSISRPSMGVQEQQPAATPKTRQPSPQETAPPPVPISTPKTEQPAPKQEMFEYDLEPVSPPEQNSEENSLSQMAIPLSAATTPLMGPAKGIGPPIVPSAIATPTSVPAPPSMPMWTPQVRPAHVPSPIMEDPARMTKSGSPAGPFMAWNVFTLPEAGGEVLSSGISGMGPSEPQRSHAPQEWQMSSVSSANTTAEDMESSRAVAALLETEMRPESASRLPTSAGDGSQMGEAIRPCPLPTYEPLSDDES